MNRKLVILCFVKCYLPGFRFGGPVRTIANFVDHLGDEFDIRIVTRDRDEIDTSPYSGVDVDAWNNIGKARVFYASKRSLTLPVIAKLLRDTPHDLLYLNSFFAFKFTILPLFVRLLAIAPRRPCVIAPRGEFSQSAMLLNAWKKRPYVCFSRFFGLYRGLLWQASSGFEALDISKEMGVLPEALNVVKDLPSVLPHPFDRERQRSPGPLRLVFLSRISPMKNLDYLLKALHCVESIVSLTIFGPLCEPAYWETCQALMKTLPVNVFVEYAGEVNPSDVLSVFSAFDAFVLPSRGENYGHVVLESLTAGTPVLLSDQTSWSSSADGAVQVISLADPSNWSAAIDAMAVKSTDHLHSLRSSAVNYARNYIKYSDVVAKNRNLFTDASRCFHS